MGTRGAYGIRKNGIDKITYNHFDSYPSGLGADFARFCARVGKKGLGALFENIELVSTNSEPTQEQIDACVKAGYCDETVSERSRKDWYCLLRGLMGDFNEYERLAETGEKTFMIDDASFLKDSLFCEYAYVANLDEGVLEFWEGFQKTPQEGNRYGTEASDGYYPCRLSATFPLDGLTVAKVKEIVRKMENPSGAPEEEESSFAKVAQDAGLSEQEAEEAAELFEKMTGKEPKNPETVFYWENSRKMAEEVIAVEYGRLKGLKEYVDFEGFAENHMKEKEYVRLNNGKIVGFI